MIARYETKLHACLGWSLIVLMVSTTAGCTEMKIEGDAKIFQTSATGAIIGTLLGLGLLVLGGLSVVASFWPDRKPRNEYEAAEGGTPLSQRIGLAIFGGGMGFMGFCLTIMSLLFSNKLHVTIYPDRVEMASTFNQARGKGVVVPFANVNSIDIIQERGLGRKMHKFLVFTLKDGGTIRQDANNNEVQALETLKQALADYQKRPQVEKPKPIAAAPARGNQPAARAEPSTAAGNQDNSRFGVNTRLDAPSTQPSTEPQSTQATATDLVVGTLQDAMAADTANRTSSGRQTAKSVPTIPTTPNFPASAPGGENEKYRLKRYVINIPIQNGYSLVGPNTEVEVGQKLAACYARHWELVTVRAVNSDGTITCDWDEWPGFTYKMLREDLTIANR